jgi:hypothetical protein
MKLARGAVAALLLCACGPSPEALERGRVLAAIDRVRDAPAGEIPIRRRLVVDLEQMVAVVPDVILARDTCATAYRVLIDGTELQNGVRAALEKGEASPAIAARLLEAESKIKQSETVMPDCERAVGKLRLPGRH